MAKKHLLILIPGFTLLLLGFSFLIISTDMKVYAQDATATPEAFTDEELIEQGETLYTYYCATCHQAEGQGVEGGAGVHVAPLAGNNFVTGSPEGVLPIILDGYGPMPGFENDLTHEEIAAVFSYIRNAWTNEASVVQPATVAEIAADQSE